MTNLKVKARPHTVTVGKDGLNEALFAEMRIQLKRHGIIRVQLNREVAQGRAKVEVKKMLAEKLKAKVKHAVGFVVVLEKG